ncbi:MAG: hypothetical protein JSV09_04910, partial [Thermoplasmata archaeon]
GQIAAIIFARKGGDRGQCELFFKILIFFYKKEYTRLKIHSKDLMNIDTLNQINQSYLSFEINPYVHLRGKK